MLEELKPRITTLNHVKFNFDILLRDTLRPAVQDSLAWFRREGVSIRVLSGDDPRTVAAVARQLELEGADRIVDCSKLSDEELRQAAKDRVIFGRLTPVRKKLLVEALKAAGHSVAMTGDGVNDIPSLKASDCSIAIGGGAEATEHAAQIVLLNGDFNSLPAVVSEGRRVIGNITRTASLFLVKTLYSFVLSMLLLAVPLRYPFEPIQLTLVSGLTVGIPSVFLALEPSSERAAGHFLKRILLRAAPGAAAVVCCAMAAMITVFTGTPHEIASTMATVSAGIIGLANLILTCQPFTRLRIRVCAAMCLCFALVVAFLEKLPGAWRMDFLRVRQMASRDWLVLSVITFCGMALLALLTRLIRPRLQKLSTIN